MKFVLIALTVVLIMQTALVAASPGTSTLQPLGIALEAYRLSLSSSFPAASASRRGRSDGIHGCACGSSRKWPHHRAAARQEFWRILFWRAHGRIMVAGYRVIAPDQIGWGKSSKPDIRYSFQLLAANTAHLLDTLHVTKAVVLGHSTGGMLAVRFALMYPERVSQLILEDPIGLEDYRARRPLNPTQRCMKRSFGRRMRKRFVLFTLVILRLHGPRSTNLWPMFRFA